MSLGFSCSHTGSRTSLSTWNEQEPGSPTLAILSSLGEGWSCLEHSFGTLCLVLCPSHFLVLDESRGGICLTGSQGLSSWARVHLSLQCFLDPLRYVLGAISVIRECRLPSQSHEALGEQSGE